MARHSNYDYLIKLLMIGDSGVGKTSLLLRFADHSFNPNFISTIGIDFKVKTIQIDNKIIKLQLWDTAGQERYRAVTTAYYRGASGILLIYDTTDKKSFENIKNWMSQIELHTNKKVKILLVGNKNDLVEKRIIDTKDGKLLADSHKIKFMETSAKSGLDVDEAFISLIRNIIIDINDHLEFQGDIITE